MAAGIGDGELVVGVELFAGIDGEDGRLAVMQLHAAAVGVEDIFGVDEIAMVLDEPIDTIGFAAFLIRGQGENDVALRTKALAVQPEKRLTRMASDSFMS